MSAESRWLRLSVDWHASDWLTELPWPVRAVWPAFLAYVKQVGTAGKCKIPPMTRFAGGLDIPAEYITALLCAAETHGALRIEDGHWIITKWEKYQPSDNTNAERQKRHRQKKQVQTPPDNEKSQQHNAVTPSRDRDRDIDSDSNKPESSTTPEPDCALVPAGNDLTIAEEFEFEIWPEHKMVNAGDPFPAKKIYAELRREGVPMEGIRDGDRRYVAFIRSGGDGGKAKKLKNFLAERGFEQEWSLPKVLALQGNARGQPPSFLEKVQSESRLHAYLENQKKQA